ncbi:hypothetical protein H3H37_25210 [Duganella sp. LX20W]|uniref:Uncharacterized protein n=1 Tax=Rugamonas brunnea TaxID=2758569 RepID=A0A7W2IES2_9BURK|nr:hypothetical protein [Rugamonas brunnea]MBA5640362.1 hypothetical protein [Rugamonas brunnea]
MLENISNFQVRELSADDNCWRVDWFGAVSYAERFRRQSQPLIEVQFSLVADEECDELSLFDFQARETPITKHIRFPVGLLPLFKVGDFWRSGRRVRSPDYDIAHFDNVIVGSGSTSLIKAGLPHNEAGDFYLPLGAHPYHIKHTQSYCVHVETEAGHLIIPSVELLRFYFGSSSTLVARLFDAPLKLETLWIGVEEADSRGMPKIHLAPGLSGRSASDIGRIAFSKEARSAAEIVGNSCLVATANGERAYVKAVFPFFGSADLKASGKWLPLGDDSRGVFLVFKLLSCSHPFPFASLRYTSELTNRANGKGKTKENRATRASSQRYWKPSISEKAIVDAEPGRGRPTSRLGLFTEGIKFTDLVRKPVSKIEPDQAPTVLVAKDGISIFTGSAVGENGPDASIKPMDLVEASEVSSSSTVRKYEDHFIEVFRSVLQQLQGSRIFASLNIVRLSPRQKSGVVSSMPQIVDENGEIAEVCLMPMSGGDSNVQQTRRRRIAIGCAARALDRSFFFIPEPLCEIGEIELHVIEDRHRMIQGASSLLSVIALLFSEVERPTEARQLISSMTAFTVKSTMIDGSAEQVAEDLLLRCGHVFGIENCNGLSPSGRDEGCPEYLR